MYCNSYRYFRNFRIGLFWALLSTSLGPLRHRPAHRYFKCAYESIVWGFTGSYCGDLKVFMLRRRGPPEGDTRGTPREKRRAATEPRTQHTQEKYDRSDKPSLRINFSKLKHQKELFFEILFKNTIYVYVDVSKNFVFPFQKSSEQTLVLVVFSVCWQLEIFKYGGARIPGLATDDV